VESCHPAAKAPKVPKAPAAKASAKIPAPGDLLKKSQGTKAK
jgi:hypothetical protein